MFKMAKDKHQAVSQGARPFGMLTYCPVCEQSQKSRATPDHGLMRRLSQFADLLDP